MPARRRITGAGLAAFGPLALLGPGCGQPAGEAIARATTAGPPPVVRVTTVKPERMTVRRTTEQPGQIEASEVTPMHAKLAGYVRAVSVDIGDRVKEGQVLAELRVPEVEADLRRKRALVEQARAEVTQAEATVDV